MCDKSNYSYKVTKTTTRSGGGSSNLWGLLGNNTSNGTVVTTTTYTNGGQSSQVIQNCQTSRTTNCGTPSASCIQSAQQSHSSNSSLDVFREAALNHHNALRKKHGAPAMQLTDEINQYAQDWAKTLAAQNKFYHRPNGKYGENIYTSWSSDPNSKPSAEEAIQSFYDEIKYYRFGGEPGNFAQVGHFTQVVWDESIELGVGMAKSSSGSCYVVCNYSPRGNMMGSFARHVAKPIY